MNPSPSRAVQLVIPDPRKNITNRLRTLKAKAHTREKIAEIRHPEKGAVGTPYIAKQAALMGMPNARDDTNATAKPAIRNDGGKEGWAGGKKRER